MAATVTGLAYFYGITATSPTNSQIVSLTLTKSDANVNTVQDGTGATVTRRNDDQQDVLDIELKVLSGYTQPNIADVLTVVDGGTPSAAGEYQVMTSVLSCQTKDFKTFKLTAIKSEYLDLTP